MMKGKARVSYVLLQAVSMRDSGKKIRSTDRENIPFLMEISIRDNGSRGIGKVKEHTLLYRAKYMKAIGKMARSTA